MARLYMGNVDGKGFKTRVSIPLQRVYHDPIVDHTAEVLIETDIEMSKRDSDT